MLGAVHEIQGTAAAAPSVGHNEGRSPAHQVQMTRINPELNMARFYTLDIQMGLFGDMALVRKWGRIGARGQTLEVWFTEPDKAHKAFDRLLRAKQRRGYVVLEIN